MSKSNENNTTKNSLNQPSPTSDSSNSKSSNRATSSFTSSENARSTSTSPSTIPNVINASEDNEMPALVKEHLKNKFKYELVSFVCKGSTCLVYKLVDSKGAFLAAKVLDRSKLSSLVLNQLLPNELTIVREVRHPYIIRVDNVFTLGLTSMKAGYSVIVSEFASDGDLIGYIEQTKKPNIPVAKKWFVQVVEALVYLHSIGIAHRDVKADNILLCSGIAKLGDFGYAIHCLDAKGQVMLSMQSCGTLEYKAPEAIRCNKPYNPLISDMFSLGVLLYVMVTHCFPFGSGEEIRTASGLNMHYNDVTGKKWKPTGAIAEDPKLHCLLCQLLNPEVKERITAMQTLVHPWLHDYKQQQHNSSSNHK